MGNLAYGLLMWFIFVQLLKSHDSHFFQALGITVFAFFTMSPIWALFLGLERKFK